MRRLVKEAHETALSLLRGRLDTLHKMAEALLVEETLDAEAVESIVSGLPRQPRPAPKGLPRRYAASDKPRPAEAASTDPPRQDPPQGGSGEQEPGA